MEKYHQAETSSGVKSALLVGVGFVLGCHLGSYFLSGVVLIVMVATLVHYST